MAVVARARRAGVCSAVLLALVTALPGVGTAQEADDYARDCFWVAADDPNALNVAYPDEGANYWGGGLTLTPGTEVRLTGRFPFARYMSFNLYSPQLAPIDALADVQIEPDDGAANPFAVGAARQAEPRAYTVRIVAGPAPEVREPNTLYADLQGQPSLEFITLYRLYVPDDGQDASGGVGLPEVSVVLPGEEMLDQQASCDALSVTAPPTINELQADGDLGDTPAAAGGARDVLRWTRFFNLPRSQAESNLSATPLAPIRGVVPATNNGGYLSNIHNTYGAVQADRSYGPVLVLEGRAPTVPETAAGQEVMADGQLRYWSLCENERNSTRFLGCVFDETAVLGQDGSLTVVVSTPEDRPANATPDCGVNWIPWGAQPEALLILRHMLPNPSFRQTVFDVTEPYTIDAVVGEYLPRGNHLPSPAEFEARGCPAGHTQGGFDADPATVDRIDGSGVLDPVALSVAVSQARFGVNSAGRAVIATSGDFADALAGSTLTADAPLLLTSGPALDPRARAELDRAVDSEGVVYLLGGAAALSIDIEAELDSAGYEVVRLGGANRIETAVAIAEELRVLHPAPESTVAIIARAFGPADGTNPSAGWADAVAVGGFAAAHHAPVFLTDSASLSEVAAAGLEAFAPTRTIVVGGVEALSDEVLAAVPEGERVGGGDRYATAAALVGEWTPGRDRFVLTDGSAAHGWVPGLLAAGLSADGAAPQLLTDSARLPVLVEGLCVADQLSVGTAWGGCS